MPGLGKQLRLWTLVGLLLSMGIIPTLAQDDPRALEPNTGVRGTFSADTPAFVYTIEGRAGQTITLELNSIDDLPISMIVTNASGEQVAGAEIASRVNVEFTENSTYYVVVFPAAATGAAPDGSFTLSYIIVAEAVAEPGVEPTGEATSDGGSAGGDVYEPPTQIITTAGLEVSLTWETTADMNLQVRDPNGESLYWDSRTTSTGGTFGLDVNGLCEVLSPGGTEVASWPAGGIPSGSYEVMVFYRQGCENQNPVGFTVNITVDGEELEPIQGTLPPPPVNTDSVYIARFDISPDGTVEQSLGSVYTLNTLPAGLDELEADAQPIQNGETIAGSITNQQVFETFQFDGIVDQYITLDMQRTAGSLDTLVMLLDPTGTLIAFSDDFGGTTNSLITNQRLLLDGTYTIVATRYGKETGGTEGTYALTFALADVVALSVPQPVLDLGFPPGSIDVSLVWNTPADLQLLVRDPAGDSVFDDSPQIPSGGTLYEAGNVNCRIAPTVQPISYIQWPAGVSRAGTYEVEVLYQNDCQQNAPTEAILTIAVNGQVVFSEVFRPDDNQRYVVAFTLDAEGNADVQPGGIVGDSTSLDFASELEDAPEIVAGTPVNGTISNDNPFDVYVFEGEAGDVVSIGMARAVANGTLDTRLFLIDPSGVQIGENDDAIPGEDTNSLISSVTLPVDGQYVVIATRFGLQYGGTVGQYRLTMQRQN
jgi:uncharacterized protein YfaP (DUF2135 family)